MDNEDYFEFALLRPGNVMSFLGERFDAFPIGRHTVLNEIGNPFQVKFGCLVCRILTEDLLKMGSGRGKLLIVVVEQALLKIGAGF